MRASVIIPTFNGGHKIANLLDSLVNQTVKDFELIVIIDGSTDNTMDVVKSYDAHLNSKVISQENRGRSYSRNKGASLAQTDILIFYDDDMIPSQDSIKKHLDFHEKKKGCLLGGNQIEIYSKTNSDIQNYKAHISEKWLSKYKNGISIMGIKNLFFTSANCSVLIQVFNKLQGFDERLSDVEDFDLAFRALKEAIPVYFDKKNTSIHNDKITCISYIKRLRQYKDAKLNWYTIHSVDKVFKFRIKRLLYLPFASVYWAQAVDRNFFLNFPKKLRYKLYDVIIQALAIEFSKIKLE